MPILLREQEQLIALKLESTYGVDPTPVGGDAIMVSDITVRALEGDVAQRNNFQGFLGGQGSIRLNTYVSVEFSIELSGSGVVDTAPYYANVYKIAGHAEVVTASTDVAYTPISENLDSGAIYYQVGEHRHTILGVRGSIAIEGGTKQLPRIRFRGFGLYVAPSKTALAGVDFSAVNKPLRWTKDTVPTLSLHGTALSGMSWSFDQGQSPEFLALTGQEEIICPTRNSTLTVKWREDDVSVKNWWESARANDVGAFAMQHGVDVTNAGYIFEFAAPNVDISNIERSFEQGIAYLTATCGIIPTAKNNDYSFTHR